MGNAGGDKKESSPSAGASGKALKKAKRKTDTSPVRQSMDPLWQILDNRIGGREGLLAAAAASDNPKAKDLLEMMLDGAYAKFGTKALARKAGLSAREVVDMYRDKKWLESILAIHEELPDIVKDAATDAKATFVPCPECKGTGTAEDGSSHYLCNGTGKLRKPGDKDKLSFMGQAAGIIGQKGPFAQVNVQVNSNQGTQAASFEDLMRKATIQIGPKKQIEGVVDAEVVGDK